MTSTQNQPPTAGNKFGTFGGVFTPSILTILGVIMFMRSGFVTGQAGIASAILILVIAKSITLLTGLSISAVSTNTRVEGGGAYFLISRSLGPEFGGSIGLALFLAQALSVPFYILGFTEALTTTFPSLGEDFLLLGVCTSVALFAVNYVGAGWAIRAQYFILTVLALSIVAFLGGALLQFEAATFAANWEPAPGNDGFWTLFAVFFPAVTGIMAGVNMSGDLAEPERSIPRGTLAAITVGALIYLSQILITGGSTARPDLVLDPYGSLLDQALFGAAFLVVAGVFAATLSSAIGSMMGAPRILQALARDHIFPGLGVFAHGAPQTDEPRRGLWLTLGMTLGVLWVAGDAGGGGALNAVAVVLTMFFLFTYGMTNMAAFIEQFSKNPSFRPRFRYFHWSTALLGAIGCFGAAVLINPLAAVASLVIVAVLFVFISRRVLATSFGDARRGFYYERVRANLRRLSRHPPHPKNWRATTLVLSGNPQSRLTLTKVANWVEGGRGIVTVARVLTGDFHENVKRRREAERELEQYVAEHGISAFVEVIVSPTFDAGFSVLLQAHSLGPLKPNLVLVGWPTNPDSVPMFASHLRISQELGMSQLIVVDHGIPEAPQRIDVWWRGERNGSLMMILAYLFTTNWTWRRARIRLLQLCEPGETVDEARVLIDRLIEASRMEAETVILPAGDFRTAFRARSADADLVLLGFFPPPDDAAARSWHATYSDLVADMPTTLIVCSSGEADLLS